MAGKRRASLEGAEPVGGGPAGVGGPDRGKAVGEARGLSPGAGGVCVCEGMCKRMYVLCVCVYIHVYTHVHTQISASRFGGGQVRPLLPTGLGGRLFFASPPFLSSEAHSLLILLTWNR